LHQDRPKKTRAGTLLPLGPLCKTFGEQIAEEKQMGFFGILKANLGSIKKQREIEAAMLLEDDEKTKRLIAESISEILRASLTKEQLTVLQTINEDHGEILNQLLSQAFQRGWTRDKEPNLSNAMDEGSDRTRRTISKCRRHTATIPHCNPYRRDRSIARCCGVSCRTACSSSVGLRPGTDIRSWARCGWGELASSKAQRNQTTRCGKE